jgi:hypothetical protein
MPDLSTASESLLEALAELLRAVEQRNLVDANALNALTKIAAEFDAAGAETLTLRGMAMDIEQRRAAAVEKLAEAEAALLRTTATLAATERQAAQAQARSVTLRRIRAGLRQLEDTQSRRAEAAAQLEKSAAETGPIETSIAALREGLARAMGQRADRRALSDRVTLARRRAEISAKLSVTRAEIDRLTPLLVSRQAAELRAQREAITKRDAAAQALIARVSADLRAHNDRAR